MAKIVLVTGASAGIGKATAIFLAQSGYQVYGAARRTENMHDLNAYGIRPVTLDLTKDESIQACVEQILREAGINYLTRLGIKRLGVDYHRFPQRALFDKIGVRTMVLETDPYGNFLTQGYELASGRDWARLGNLYLQDGVWNGERLLAEGFAKFVSTLAPAWVADGRPMYGGLFWVNGDGGINLPQDAYLMNGAGGQSVAIIPSHDLVVVRLGHYKGNTVSFIPQRSVYSLLMEAVPIKKGVISSFTPPVSIALREAILDSYVGVYEGPYGTNPKATFTITREGDQLFEQLSGEPKLPISPRTETTFFYRTYEKAHLEFVRDDRGKVLKRILTENGHTSEATKIH